MVNFGPLAAEIGSGVWGTPTNFNRFCILAALLHSTPAVGVSQTCGIEQTAQPIFGRATITMGNGRHSRGSYIKMPTLTSTRCGGLTPCTIQLVKVTRKFLQLVSLVGSVQLQVHNFRENVQDKSINLVDGNVLPTVTGCK